MQTSGFQGYGRGIRKVGPKFSEGIGVDRASELGVRSCGRGVRLLQPPRPRMSPGGCSTTSSYIDNSPAPLYDKFKFLSPIRGTTISQETPEVLPPSPPESTSTLSSSPTTPPQSQCLPSECNFCNRPAGQLVCQTCGHSFHGRVRMRCPQHPVIIHLMDCEFCPQCLSNQLREFRMA